MRAYVLVLVTLACGSGVPAQAFQERRPAPRYGIEPNLEDFPQKTPQQALGSVLKAFRDGKIDYLAAQLADPAYVDARVRKVHGGRFEDFVREIREKHANDPGTVKRLERYLAEGTWESEGAVASARLKDAPERVYLRKVNGRWYLENRNRPENGAKEPTEKE